MKLRGGNNERGASIVEYALLVALISLAALTGVASVGTETSVKLACAGAALDGTVGGSFGGGPPPPGCEVLQNGSGGGAAGSGGGGGGEE